MLKYLLTTLLTAGLSIATTLVAVDFQRERLIYSLSAPVQLGDLTHQKLRIINNGWAPATNIKIYLSKTSQAQADVQATVDASPPFDLPTPSPIAVGGYERLRKNEMAIIELTFKGPPLAPDTLSIKSDETIAVLEGSLEAQTLLSTLMKAILPESNEDKLVKVNCGV